MPRVEWRPVAGSPGYDVSSDGQVRSPRGRVLRAAPNSKGYLKVCLTRARQEYVHRLVAFAFLGPPPQPWYEVDHRNFHRFDNRVTNLRWLPGEINCRRQRWRWTARTSDGRNVWTDVRHMPAPEGWEPMTDEELADWAAQVEAEGWAG